MNSVLPSLTRAIAEKSERLFALLRNAFLFLFSVGLPIGVLLFLLSRETAGIISTEAFLSSADHSGSDTALRILAGMIPLAFCSMFFGFLLIASGKQKLLIWINLATVLFNLLLDFWTIPHYGFVGAAYASLASECIMLSLMAFFSMRTIRFVPEKSSLLKILFATAIAGGLSWIAYGMLQSFGSLMTLLLVTLFFFVVYFGILWKLQVITPEILALLKKGNSEMK